MPRLPIPCPSCGKKRLVSGVEHPERRLCWDCYLAKLGNGQGKRPKPQSDQQFKATHAVDKNALQPKCSWWAERDFDAAFQRERPRLLAIGANVPNRWEHEMRLRETA